MVSLGFSKSRWFISSINETHQIKPLNIDGFCFRPTISKIQFIPSSIAPSCSSRPSPFLHITLNQKLQKEEEEEEEEEETTDYNTVIYKLCKVGKLKEAMDLLDGLNGRKPMLDSHVFCSILQLCADLKSLTYGRKTHLHLSSLGIKVDSVLGAKLVFTYVKCGDLKEARKIFDGITKENAFLWNLVMNEYVKLGDFKESFSLFRNLIRYGTQPDSYTFSCVLKCLASLGAIREGEQVHGYLTRTGYDSSNTVGNALVTFYSKCGRVEIARKVFDKIPERDVISWNSIIGGYVSNGFAEKGVGILREMQICGIAMDLATLVTAIPACAGLSLIQQGKELHGYAIKTGFDEEITLKNSIIDMYSKCGYLDHAIQVFEKMPSRNVVSWTSMISGYARCERFDRSIELFEEMESEGVEPDMFTITSILHVCSCNGSLQHGKSIHNYIKRNGLESNLFVANAVVDMYAKCGSMPDAISVFDGMYVKDIVSWNSMIGGYSKNSLPIEALSLFQKMQLKSKPNGVTIACVLPACASLSALERGREIHGSAVRNGFCFDGYVTNALIDMYVKCGALVQARALFDATPNKDLITWTVMIAGYGMHGYGRDAIEVFSQMQDMDIKPDELSFIAILYACSHSGLVEEGWRFFNIMRYDRQIEPKLEHYACMVDLLSRAGQLTKAYKFIKSMPIDPDATVWGALLSGCRYHRNVELAEEVAENVFELEPENTGYYVLLANIYAEAEKWESVKRLRERISRRGLSKNPGCSWIEIKRQIYVFVAGDRSHPQPKKIKLLLQRLRAKMKEDGYVPEKRYALIDGDEMRREVALCGHSEKLAIAFGVLSLPHGKPIRVTKNLRVCGDCHEAAKAMSKMVGRDIILRDSNRFHHFKEGRCSCRGYW